MHSLTNSDGAYPAASLILSGNTLYGTTSGTVFQLNTNGSSFTVLMTFPGGVAYDPNNGTETNSVGYKPFGSLILSDNTLYGTTSLRSLIPEHQLVAAIAWVVLGLGFCNQCCQRDLLKCVHAQNL